MAKLTKREVLDIILKNDDITVTTSEILSKINMDIKNVADEDLKRLEETLYPH